MRLAAVYNVFDGEELLRGSLASIRPHVEYAIAVVQTVGNRGEAYDGGREECEALFRLGLLDVVWHFQPDLSLPAVANERDKR
jgi:hypothetical protein